MNTPKPTNALLLLVALGIALFVTCSRTPTVNPCDQTIDANYPEIRLDSITAKGGSVLVSGRVVSTGADNSVETTTYGIVYSESGTPALGGIGSISQEFGTANVDNKTISETLNNLNSGNYTFRLYIVHCTGTFYSTERTLGFTNEAILEFSYELVNETDGDGEVEGGEIARYKLKLENKGVKEATNLSWIIQGNPFPNYVESINLLDQVPTTIAPGDSSIIIMDVAISSMVPDMHVINIEVDISYTGGNPISPPAIMIPVGGVAILNEVSNVLVFNDNTPNAENEINIGETITVQLQIRNFGTVAATNVKVKPASPIAGIIFPDDEASPSIAQLAANEQLQLDLDIQITEQAAAQTTSVPIFITQDMDMEFLDSIIMDIQPKLQPSLKVSNTTLIDDNNGLINAGENVVLRLDIANEGTGDATNVSVTANNLTGITFNSSTNQSLIAPGETKSIEIELSIDSAVSPGEKTLDLSFKLDEPGVYEDQVTIAVSPALSPNLVLDSASPSDAAGNDNDIINNGETISYRFRLKNVGELTAENITISPRTITPDIITNLSSTLIQAGTANINSFSGFQIINFTVNENALASDQVIDLAIEANGGAYTTTLQLPVNVKKRVVANIAITSDTTNCFAPCAIQFDGSDSEGDNLTYTWDFGDGSSGQGRTPAPHLYDKALGFPVRLEVRGDGGEDVAEFHLKVSAFTKVNEASYGFDLAYGAILMEGSGPDINYYFPAANGLNAYSIINVDRAGSILDISSSFSSGEYKRVNFTRLLSNGNFLFTLGDNTFANYSAAMTEIDKNGNTIFFRPMAPVNDNPTQVNGAVSIDRLSGTEGYISLGIRPDGRVISWFHQGGDGAVTGVNENIHNSSGSFVRQVALEKNETTNEYYVFILEYTGSDVWNFVFQKRDPGFNLKINPVNNDDVCHTAFRTVVDEENSRIVVHTDAPLGEGFFNFGTRVFQMNYNGHTTPPLDKHGIGFDFSFEGLPAPKHHIIKTSDGHFVVAQAKSIGSNTSLFLAKYDPGNNEFIWERELEKNTGFIIVQAIAETPDCGIVIIGRRDSNVLFIKTDPEGNLN